jgi:ADP-heptose:LPS heptosyltransferase
MTASCPPADPAGPQRILVIKHSALGDVVLATAAFQAIRRHHPQARIELLTTAPYRGIAEASGLFDAVRSDPRAGLGRPLALLRLIRALRAQRYQRVYDLQRSDRTALYFRLLAFNRRLEWVGPARGASHRTTGHTARRHIAEREAEQLATAGLSVGSPDLSFLQADLSRFALPARIALLVPGGAAHRPGKRWPAARFAALGRHLADRGIAPVLLGTRLEAGIAGEIQSACPAALDLHGRTDFADLAELARRAELAVGNDTGPMHLIAAAGCPSVVLFGGDSDPVKIAPRGRWVAIRERDPLADLSVDEVIAALPGPDALSPAPR